MLLRGRPRDPAGPANGRQRDDKLEREIRKLNKASSELLSYLWGVIRATLLRCSECVQVGVGSEVASRSLLGNLHHSSSLINHS